MSGTFLTPFPIPEVTLRLQSDWAAMKWWEYAYVASGLTTGHAIVRIEYNNGVVQYYDAGWLGGDDHDFLERDIPRYADIGVPEQNPVDRFLALQPVKTLAKWYGNLRQVLMTSPIELPSIFPD